MSDILAIVQNEITYWEGQLLELDLRPIRDAVQRTKVLGALDALDRILKGLQGRRA